MNKSANLLKYKCLVPRRHPELAPEFWPEAGELFDLVYYDEFVSEPAKFGPEISAAFATFDCEIFGKKSRSWLHFMPGLKIVASYGVGVDHLPLTQLINKSITVTNTPGIVAEATADTAVHLLLSACRRAPQATLSVTRGNQWPGILPGRDIGECRVGIVGMGSVGQAVAKRCRLGFGCRVAYTKRRRLTSEEEERLGVEFVGDLDELLARTDALVLACPLTEDTRCLINERRLSLLPDNSVVVNVGRGPLIDTAALLACLRSGRLLGVGLDVADPEPLPADHPLVADAAELNATVTPHIGTHTVETLRRLHRLCLDNIQRVLGGRRPLTPVTASA